MNCYYCSPCRQQCQRCPCCPCYYKKNWLQASSLTNQIITQANTPQRIIIDTFDDGKGIDLNTSTGKIHILEDGKYFIIAAPQVRNRCCNYNNFRCWLNKNGSPIENSNVLLRLNRCQKDVIVTQKVIKLRRGDTIEVMMASNSSNCVGIETISCNSEPTVPSIIFSMFKI